MEKKIASKRRVRHTRLGRIVKIILTIVVVGVVLFLSATSLGRAYVRSSLLVLHIFSGAENSILSYLTNEPEETIVVIPTTWGEVAANFYQPAREADHPAIIFALGYPSTNTDPQLTQVSEGLARLGYVVLTPQLPGMQDGELVRSDVDILVEVFEWLANSPYVDPGQIGFSGFCVGSSLALVAAQDPRINEQVALVNVFGGYYDLTSFLRAIATHTSNDQGQEYPWQPAGQTMALFAQNILFYLNDPEDREILLASFQTGTPGEQPLSGLSPTGEIAYALLTNNDPAKVDTLLKQIPPEILMKMEKVSPRTGMDQLRTKVFIMHDMSDPYVPVTESYRLAEAIQDPAQKVYAQFSLFEHVRPTHSLQAITLIGEGFRLIVYLGNLLDTLEPR